jgi:SAM-dependent methyltransferase
MFMDLATVQQILRVHGCPARDLPEGFDTRSKVFNDNNTNAQTLFALLGAVQVSVLDISDYQHADIVCDLGSPIDDPGLHGRFDVIFDSGTLEHIFNIPVALANISRMLSVGGHLVLMNPCSNAIDHGFYSISPTLYYDYFNANGFEDLCCYLLAGSNVRYDYPAKVYTLTREVAEYPFSSRRTVSLAFFATKKTDISIVNEPLQSLYTEVVWKRSVAHGQRRSALERILLWGSKVCPEFAVEKIVEQRRRRRKGVRYLATW